MRSIHIKGARQNNLKNIDVVIPHQKLVVLTGPSGSGKSSLAFDTVFAEGKRKFVESLSTYARQFLERVEKPDVDSIENISPTIAIEQKNAVKNSRSTVGTSTELYDYLRLLFAKIGVLYCPECHKKIQKENASDVAQFLLKHLPNQEVLLIAPLEKSKDISWKDFLQDLQKKGFSRVLFKKEIKKLSELKNVKSNSLSLVVDRIHIDESKKSRLFDSIGVCYEVSKGVIHVYESESKKIHKFSLDFSCPRDKIKFPDINPHFFSFNNPYGACPSCNGFGNHLILDEELIVPDPELSLEAGALDPWNKPSHQRWKKKFLEFAKKNKIKTKIPYKKLSKKEKKLIFEGDKTFKGINGFFERLDKKKYKLGVRVFLSRYKNPFTCNVCKGKRLREETNWVLVHGKNIIQMLDMTVSEGRKYFSSVKLEAYEETIASDILRQVRDRLEFLHEVGLDYLSLSRLTRTLSGGEYQRIQLARQLGSKLTETTYILDEPTIGLHAKDIERFLSIIEELRDEGNTVLVVEHEKAVIEKADHIIELGPGAGEQGGKIVFEGAFQDFKDTLTAHYVKGKNAIPIPKERRESRDILCLNGAEHHNLKKVELKIPLGTFVCITGVSGSGKTSLIQETLYRALAKLFYREPGKIGVFKSMSGFQSLHGVKLLNQKPIGRSVRSNPITYMKAYDEVREIFSETLEARRRGFKPGHFSFNIPGGRCEGCEGSGVQIIDMQFLEDIELTCERCNGAKFKKEILEVKYKNKNINEVLNLTVAEAMSFFGHSLNLMRKLSILRDVGLDYLKLGQSAPTLSGGEAQRLKIAKELSLKSYQNHLYILDEPTTGLHLEDVKKLLYVLNRLVNQGNTVVVIEHNLDVIKCADYIVDLGPDGGKGGGKIIASGKPEEIINVKQSYTGQFLQSVLST
ncbi:MAG: excinuclease ABC subunit UvrA [Deltaproteobacteria bacterium]|nr:excinuclease ABC subunit UvrA [Deltaproteobacteria bacterium]